MRHKRAVTTAALAVLALGIAGIVTKAFWIDDATAREQLRIETVLSIDDEPLSELAVGEGSLWALDGDEGIVYEVKPETNELGRVLGTDPSSRGLAVADGRVWTVGHRKGYVTSTPLTGAPDDVRRFTVVPVADDERLPSSLRMHATTDRVWIAAGVDRPAVALDAESVSGYPPAVAGGSLANLSAIGGDATSVWGMTLDGRVARLSRAGDIEWDRRVPGETNVEEVAVDGTGVWLLDDERILRVDSGDGKIRRIEGDARDIELGDGLLWVATAHHVAVYDATTARPLGEIQIDTELLAVAYLDHSAWVLGEGGKIFRVSMDDEPLQLTHPLQDDRLVYAYSADGELWAEQVDGDDVNLVVSPEEDRRPSISPDGKTIAFQRERGISGGVYFLDLSNGEERFLGHGGWPTYGHAEGFAYVSRGHGVYGINFVDGRDATFVATAENPAALTWGAADRELYFVAGPPGQRSPYRITLDATGAPGTPEPLRPVDGPAGASYPVAAIGADGRLFAVRQCCVLPRAEIIYEFGYIDSSDPARTFVPLLELTETGMDEPITLVSMGAMVPPALEDPQQWLVTDATEAAWLLSDGYTVTYLYRDGLTWSFADQRLEHPGRRTFDGFSTSPAIESELRESEPAAPPE
ncbi:MAG: hypothetical protein M3271_00290 [Actinomycetota bacterium]|nr:hypothetical protein [Actinomycetota bacterium]